MTQLFYAYQRHKCVGIYTVAMQDFRKRGSRKGSERKAQAEILATPPQQLVIDHVENFATTTEHAHTIMLLQQFFDKFICS